MPAASHKFQNSHIDVVSQLSAEKLLRIGEEVGETTVGTGIYKPGLSNYRVHVVNKSGSTINCRIGNKKTLMQFVVAAHQRPGEPAKLITDITSFRTKQDALLGVIPSGPKELLGYHWYKQYMLDLEEAMKKADPEAQVTITERA